MNQGHALVHHLLRETALRHGVRVVLADGGEAAIESFLRGVLDQDGDAGVGERHRDAAAHGARADDGRFAERIRGGVLRDVRDLRDGALGEEGVDQRGGLVGGRATGGDLALRLQPSSKGSVVAASSASSAIERRGLVAARLAGQFAPAANRARGRGSPMRVRASLEEAAPPHFLANAMAAGSEVAFDERRSSPSSSATGALMIWPDTIISAAFAMPTRRGRRWVPPAPGTIPRLASGRPTWALGTATR